MAVGYANELLLEVTTTIVRSEWGRQSATIDTLGLHICVGRPAQPMHQMEAHYDFIGSFTSGSAQLHTCRLKLAQSSRAIMVTPPKGSHAFKENTRTIEPFAPQLAGS